MTAGNDFWTLILTASQFDLLFLISADPITTFDIKLTQSTMTHLTSHLIARITRGVMTSFWTGMVTTFGSRFLTLRLALAAVGAALHIVGGVLHAVAVPGAVVVAAGQFPAAFPAARRDFGREAGPICGLVAAETRHRNRNETIGTCDGFDFVVRGDPFPGDGALYSLVEDLDLVVAGSGATVAALEPEVADLLAVGAWAKVAVMLVPLLVMTIWRSLTWLLASWGLGVLLCAAGNQKPTGSTIACHLR